MINCEWCGKSIEKGYLNNTNKTICLDCAENDLSKMIELRVNLNTEIAILAVGIRKLKEDLCKHENLIDTGYGKGFNITGYISLFKCNDLWKRNSKEYKF